MKPKFSPLVLIRDTFRDWLDDKALRLSAALAYYAIFSIAPLLVIVSSVAGLIFGEAAVQGHLKEQIVGYVGSAAAETIQSMVQSVSHKTDSLWATVLGVVTLLVGAGGVFGQLKDALNTIWEVKLKPSRGLGRMVGDRFLSFTMVLGTGFLLLVSLVISTILSAATKYLAGSLPLTTMIWGGLNFLISLGVVMILFAMIFRYLPDVKIEWRDVWIGALVTALLFNLGKYVLGLYLGREALTSAYGAAGAGIVILLWVYYASLILLWGAEFTQVYAKARGRNIQPDSHAVPVSPAQRCWEGLDQTTHQP